MLSRTLQSSQAEVMRETRRCGPHKDARQGRMKNDHAPRRMRRRALGKGGGRRGGSEMDGWMRGRDVDDQGER
jgi:hypothetical protein